MRLQALRDHPEAYGSSFEEEEHDDMARFIGERPSVTLGAFAGDAIAGTAAFVVSSRIKQRHKGHIVAVYVRPEWRRTSLAADLMRHLIGIGREEGLSLLTLSVTTGNTAARRLYRSLGFIAYGCEPSSLLVDGRLHDEELMALVL